MTRGSALGEQALQALASVESTLGKWMAELEGWFDGSMKRFDPVIGRVRLVARVVGNEISIHEMRGETAGAAVKIARTGARAIATGVADKVAGGDVMLHLDSREVLAGEVELPAAAVSDIRQALSFQLPRLLPLSTEDVLFGATVLKDESAKGRLIVGYAVARKEIVARLCKTLELHGYGTGKIMASPMIAGQARTIELERPGHGSFLSMPFFNHPTTGIAAVGIAIFLAIGISQLRDSQISAASHQSQAAREQAGGAISLAQRAAALRATASEMATVRSAPSAGAVLSEMAAHTPDDAYFDKISLTETEVRISGYASTAASVLSELGHSTLLTNVSFATPVVVDSGTARERFDIRADLVSENAAAATQAEPAMREAMP